VIAEQPGDAERPGPRRLAQNRPDRLAPNRPFQGRGGEDDGKRHRHKLERRHPAARRRHQGERRPQQHRDEADRGAAQAPPLRRRSTRRRLRRHDALS
jgi:hypothetical protein